MYLCIYSPTHIYVYTCTQIFMLYIFTYKYTYIYICIHAMPNWENTFSRVSLPLD